MWHFTAWLAIFSPGTVNDREKFPMQV